MHSYSLEPGFESTLNMASLIHGQFNSAGDQDDSGKKNTVKSSPMSMMSCVLDEVFSCNIVTNKNLDGSINGLSSFVLRRGPVLGVKVLWLLRCGLWLTASGDFMSSTKNGAGKPRKCLALFD